MTADARREIDGDSQGDLTCTRARIDTNGRCCSLLLRSSAKFRQAEFFEAEVNGGFVVHRLILRKRSVDNLRGCEEKGAVS
jgi:hypothetical protein